MGDTSALDRLRPAWYRTREFLGGVFRKAEEDNIFFLAGAISFNVLVAFLPLVVAVIGIAGTILAVQGADVTRSIVDYAARFVPAGLDLDVEGMITGLREQSGALLSIGTVILIWIATRLVGTLRAVLQEIFDLQEGRSIVEGKLYDIKMVFMAGTLFALNIGITIALGVVAEVGATTLGIESAPVARALPWARVAAFITILAMFVLIYRYLPAQRIRWSTCLVAATFTTIFFELLKGVFGWYVTSVADYGSTFGNIATLVVLFLWIYYSSIVFILGGEVAHVAAMQRVRRRQRERLS